MPFTLLFCLFSSRLLTLSITLLIFLSYFLLAVFGRFYSIFILLFELSQLRDGSIKSIPVPNHIQHPWNTITLLTDWMHSNSDTLLMIVSWFLSHTTEVLSTNQVCAWALYVYSSFRKKKKLRKITSNLIFHFVFLFFVHFPSDFI